MGYIALMGIVKVVDVVHHELRSQRIIVIEVKSAGGLGHRQHESRVGGSGLTLKALLHAAVRRTGPDQG
jgi:hypothetical protein